jgi:hypothetical protein
VEQSEGAAQLIFSEFRTQRELECTDINAVVCNAEGRDEFAENRDSGIGDDKK